MVNHNRIAGSVKATPLCELMIEEAESLTDAESREAFWQCVQSLANERLRVPDPAVNLPPHIKHAVPMSDEEAREFAKEGWVYERYRGLPVGEVLLLDKSYLRWIAGSSFHQKLIRYLRNPGIARQLWDWLEDDDDTHV